MGIEQYLVPSIGQWTNICFDCANACGGCSWTEIDPETDKPRFEPVPGWKAKPIVHRYTDGKYKREIRTYCIFKCPQFARG